MFRWSLVAVAIGAGGCGSTTPTAVVTAVRVTGAATLAPGQSSQLAATATLSDNTTKDVTSAAAWQSSNAAVASVSSAGLVASLSSGAATMTATFQGKAGSILMSITAAPSGVSLVTVTGPSMLAPGQTGQLTATFTASDDTTRDVTSGAVWTSSAPQIASVSPAGMVTAVTIGNATMTAAYQSRSGTLALSVSGPLPLTACGSIQAAGQYVLAADLSGSDTCLSVNAGNVVLDCAGHTIASSTATALLITGVPGVTVKGCTLSGTGNNVAALDISSSQDVSVTNSSITASGDGAVGVFVDSDQNVTIDTSSVTVSTQQFYAIYVQNSSRIQLTNSRIAATGGDAYIQAQSSDCTISANTFSTTSTGAVGGPVILVSGSRNTVTQNLIDGGWNGDLSSWSLQGADDGIVAGGEDSDLIQGNRISNVFDAGIETIAAVTNTVISDNRIIGAGFVGVGAYHGTSWTGNTVRNNTVSNSPALTYIFFGDNSTAPLAAVAAIAFENNLFAGNAFSAPTDLPAAQSNRPVASIVIDFSSLNEGGGALPVPLTASGNVISGNSLALTIAAAFIAPASGFADGGGNVCNPSMPGNFLSCGNASVLRQLDGVFRLAAARPPTVKVPKAPRHAAGRSGPVKR